MVRVIAGALVGALALAALLGASMRDASLLAGWQRPIHFADAADAGLVRAGKRVYMQSCAACHGRSLQGQALWQLADSVVPARAPAHDQTGHTWQHGDDDLFAVTKTGRFLGAQNRPAGMPPFAGRLNDHDLVAALAFIKSRWPIGLQVSQARLNPGWAGMPEQAASADWRFPPLCTDVLRRVRAAGRLSVARVSATQP